MPSDSVSCSKPTCPSCAGRLYRVPRRFVDLIVSKFVPVRRYRCFSVACCWEGNVRDVRLEHAGSSPDTERRYIL